MSINALILLEFLASRRQQQKLYLQILKDDAKAAERSYNLIFNQTYRRRESNNIISSDDEMTGILSSLSNLTTRRSSPSFSTPTRTTSRYFWPESSQRYTWNPIHPRQRPIQRPIQRPRNNQIVPPTATEIENSTVTCRYCDCSTNQTICAISRTNFENEDEVLKIIHCGHIFKKQSLLRWFETHRTCPVCRYQIPSSTDPPQQFSSSFSLFSTR